MYSKAFRWFFVVFCLCALLLSAPPTGASQDERWLPFDGSPTPAQPTFSLVTSSPEAIELRAVVPGVFAAETAVDGRMFTRLFGEGFGWAEKVGRPALPVLRREVEVPFGANVTAEVIAAEFADLPLSELGLNPIYPLQPPVRKLDDAPQAAPFQIDEGFYAAGSLYPSTPLALGASYTVRGHRIQTVELWPVAFDPSAGTLRLYRSLSVRLELSGADMARTQALAARYASPAFEARLSQQVLNYNQGRGPVQFGPDTPVGYLIITADEYYDAILPLAELRQSRGFEVTTTKKSQIPGDGSASALKAYIQTAYDTWPTPPSYVLLVGDTNTIPTWIGPTIGTSTDLYYGTMDGQNDWHPDIGRGRFPTRSAEQTAALVDKYLAYAELNGQEPWVKKASFPATCDNYPVAEGTHNYVIGTYTEPGGYTGIFPNNPQPGGDKLYCHTYGATHSDLIAAFNDGRWAIIYSGHGSYQGWEMNFTPSDVRNLTNYGMFPFVASHACLSGDFGQAEVFGETWVLQPDKGALVFWGSSTYSYWGEDDVLERRMFDSLFAEASPHADVAQMTDFGLAGVEAVYPSSARYYWETYNVLGDPAVRIFMEPEMPTFTLSVDPTAHELCTSGSVNSTVQIGSILGYSQTVTLDTEPLPVGISASFDPPSAPAPYESLMTLDVQAGTPAGDYPVTVVATDGTTTLDTALNLRVVPAQPAVPVLLSPPDGALNQPFAPAFDWEPLPDASTYDFQLDRSPLFPDPLFDVAGLTDSGYALSSPLEGGLCYWWHVRGDNACGLGEWSGAFHFGTVALDALFADDMESGEGQWAHQAGPGVDHWTISAAQSHSPTHAWFVPDDAVITDSRLWNAQAVPLQAGSTLSFWHRYQFEGTGFDGSVLEISTDGGISWTDLGPHITANGYNGTISSSYGNPLGGRQAWVGDRVEWTRVTADLSDFAGQSAKIRWRLGCDSSVSDVGWYVDDVEITAPQPPNPAPTLVSITPDSGFSDEDTPVEVLGAGFIATPALRLGNAWLTHVVQIDPTRLAAVVPAGLEPGTYDLVLYNGDCAQATLPNAFTVLPGNSMYVGAMKIRALDRGYGRFLVTAGVRILDRNESGVPGATVRVEWTLPSGSRLGQQAVTSLSGVASFRIKSVQMGMHRVCVKKVTKAGFAYDPDRNRVSCVSLVVP